MSNTEFLAAIVALHTTAIIALTVYVVRTREKLTRLEEWARWAEKRINGVPREPGS